MLWFVLLSLSVGVSAQSSDKSNRCVPRLTSEDLLSSPTQQVITDLDATSPGKGVASGGAIFWHRDPHEAANLASSGNKLIIVDVFTDWCGWCKKMDQEIYTDPRIAALSREDVFLKLNAEDRSAGEEFARQAGVHRFPTTMILNSKGQVLDTKTGFMRTPEAFLQFVKQARASRP
jgi:Thiol:disulfide interchange protein